jgi:preprotein translocase SecE subunit
VAKEPAKEPKEAKKPRRRKSPETVRERAEKESAKKSAPKKSSKVKSTVTKPFSKAAEIGKKEYNPIRVPEKKGLKHLNKRVRFVPKFISGAWAELVQVTWPTKKEAVQKTIAVIAFALVFAAFVQFLDFIFSKVVKEIILR